MSTIKFIKVEKFKDVLISLRFASVNKVNKSARALLSIMLSDRSGKYNSKELMNEKLDNMFGATLSSAVFNYGKSNMLEISSSALSAKYVENNLLDEQVEFLSELVYKPLLNEAAFKEAKIMLKDIIERSQDSLGSYVVQQSLRIAGAGYPLEVSRYGTLEMLESLTLQDIIETYEKMINEDSLSILVVGDSDENEVQSIVSKYFKKHNNQSFESNYLVQSDNVTTEINNMDVQSPYFSIVYDTNVLNVGREYWALQLMSMVLGQLPNSYLFQEVREKRSLCYSIRSMVGAYDGILLITAGVRVGSEDEAIQISKDQLARIKVGDVSEVLFNSAKSMLINTMYQTEDSNRRIIDSEYRKLILKEQLNTNDLVELVESITVEEIVEVANKLKLNTVYKIVKGEENGENL